MKYNKKFETPEQDKYKNEIEQMNNELDAINIIQNTPLNTDHLRMLKNNLEKCIET